MIKVTFDDLKSFAPRGNVDILAAIAGPINAMLEAHKVSSPLQIAHFMAQIAHETDGFKTLEEYASGAAYEGRESLGNVVPGDGRRFKGRGLPMLTGRSNYRRYGRKLNPPIDLEREPERAADPIISLEIALLYWSERGLNKLAARDDTEGVTRAINGGRNGLTDRKRWLTRAKQIWPSDRAPSPPAPAPQPLPPIAPEWVLPGRAGIILCTVAAIAALFVFVSLIA